MGILKGKTTFKELMEMPNRIFHTLYYRHYCINVKDKDKKQAQAIQAEDELEELAEEGLM